MAQVYILGSINMDLVMETAQIPSRGETLFGEHFFVNSGGKGANQAVACAKQGIKTKLIGAVGGDAFGMEALSALKNDGVDCTFVSPKSACSTGIAIILVENHDNRILLSPGANFQITKEDIDRGLSDAQPGDIFIAQFENNPEATTYGLRVAHKKGLTVLLNPAPARKIDSSLLKNVDYLILNETECEMITGINPNDMTRIHEAHSALTLLGCSKTLLTVGDRGCYSLIDGTIGHNPALSIHPIDTTAAGDTFVGGFAYGLLAFSGDLQKVIRYATKAAGLTCLKKGAQQSIPTRNEVEGYCFTKDE